MPHENGNGDGGPPAVEGEGGGGTSGGGSSAPSGPSPEQIANLRASYEALLRSWGIPLTPRINQLIETALAGQWSTTRFISVLRGTKEYKLQFAGIQWREGMNEAQYNATYNQYQDMAQDIGFKLSREAFATLIKKGVGDREWSLRIQAVKQVRANKDYLDAFREVLVERGELKPNEKFKPKDLKDFITGKGSPVWTAIWNEAAATAQLEQVGIDVGTDIGRKQLLRILRQAQVPLAPGELVQVDYAQLYEDARRLVPLSQWYSMGVSEANLFEMHAGGKRAPQIAERVRRVLGQHLAAQELPALPQLVGGARGTQLLTGGQGAAQVTE